MAEHIIVTFALLGYLVFIFMVRWHAKKYGTAAPGSGEERPARREPAPPPRALSAKDERGKSRKDGPS